MNRVSLHRLAKRLVDNAKIERVCNSCGTLQERIRRGQNIPDYLLPGRVIMKKSLEEREAIKILKTEHFN